MTAYNNKPAIVDIVVTEGDTIDITFAVSTWNETTETWDAFDMTGMQLDLDVRKCDGTLIRSFTSSGGTPEITIATSSYNILDVTPFDKARKYKYDLQITNGTAIMTAQRGSWIVEHEHTY